MRQSIAPKTEVTTKPWIATAWGLAMTESASLRRNATWRRFAAKGLVLTLVRLETVQPP